MGKFKNKRYKAFRKSSVKPNDSAKYNETSITRTHKEVTKTALIQETTSCTRLEEHDGMETSAKGDFADTQADRGIRDASKKDFEQTEDHASHVHCQAQSLQDINHGNSNLGIPGHGSAGSSSHDSSRETSPAVRLPNGTEEDDDDDDREWTVVDEQSPEPSMGLMPKSSWPWKRQS
ncbi:hypothetical protein P7C71_g5233, partial [Lecanoromycetidae sp. Uapishka_2]